MLPTRSSQERVEATAARGKGEKISRYGTFPVLQRECRQGAAIGERWPEAYKGTQSFTDLLTHWNYKK